MENTYRRLSPPGIMGLCPGQLSPGHPVNPTLFLNDSVSRIPVSGKSCHLPLTDNCENSFWNAGKARAVLIIAHNQMGCRMA